MQVTVCAHTTERDGQRIVIRFETKPEGWLRDILKQHDGRFRRISKQDKTSGWFVPANQVLALFNAVRATPTVASTTGLLVALATHVPSEEGPAAAPAEVQPLAPAEVQPPEPAEEDPPAPPTPLIRETRAAKRRRLELHPCEACIYEASVSGSQCFAQYPMAHTC